MPPVRTSLTNTSSRFSCCRNSDIAAWGQGRGQGAGRAGLGLRPAPRAELTLRDGRGLGDEALPPRAHLRSRDGHRVFGVVAGGHDARGAALLTLFPGQAWGQREPQRVVVGSPHPCPAPPGMEAGRRCQGGPKDRGGDDNCKVAPLRGTFTPAASDLRPKGHYCQPWVGAGFGSAWAPEAPRPRLCPAPPAPRASSPPGAAANRGEQGWVIPTLSQTRWLPM